MFNSIDASQLKPFSYFYPHFYKNVNLKSQKQLFISEGLSNIPESPLIMEIGSCKIPRDVNYFKSGSNVMTIFSKLYSENLSDIVLLPYSFDKFPDHSSKYPEYNLNLKRENSTILYLSDGRIFTNTDLFQDKNWIYGVFDIIHDVYEMNKSFSQLFDFGKAKDPNNIRFKAIEGRNNIEN